MDEDKKLKVALFRIAVLGPLIGARAQYGDVAAWCREAAKKEWELPDGTVRKLSARTIEAWYLAYKKGGLAALKPQERVDAGTSRVVDAELEELLVRAKQEKPRRSVPRLIRLMERAGKVKPGHLHRSTVHRILERHGISDRPPKGPSAERRSFLCEFPGEMWIGDALHGLRAVADDGSVRHVTLFSQLDNATRYVLHSFFAWGRGEDPVSQEYGFKQALLAHGRPRVYYVDRGPAYVAGSLRTVCAELDIRLLHTGAGDAEAKGCIERWHRTWREEVEDELPKEPLPLAELESKHRAWLACEYHARKHKTTGRVPREHWLELCEHLRPLPRDKNLDELFLHRAKRTVRKDGCVRFRGLLLEVRPELCGDEVELRYDATRPGALPRVFVDGCFVCDTIPLDRYANATRRRRRNTGTPAPTVAPTGLDPLALLEEEHLRLTRPVAELTRKDNDDVDESET